MNNGWIYLHRKLLDCSIWTDGDEFDRRSAWIDLLLLANHSDKTIIFDGNKMVITRGQYLTSVRKLSERWHWSKDRTLRFLRLLEELEMIQRDSNNKRTLLTIINYGVYQVASDTHKDTDKDTHKDTDKDTDKPQTTIYNNYNNDNNINKRAHFSPPSLDDVRDYCIERSNNIDPEQFIAYYESNGWLVGGRTKMKDWKAAIRNWEKRQKNDPKPKPKGMMHQMQTRTDYDMSELEKKLLRR